MPPTSTTINTTGESGFIRAIATDCINRPETVILGIGDDTAAFNAPADKLSLITTDLLIEGIHFIKNAVSGVELGHKSLAVNLSDIAAMGGWAEHAFISIAIPQGYSLDFLTELYAGIKALAKQFGINILGGDTTASLNDLVINIAVYGSIPPQELLTRQAAKTGDRVFVTGPLGNSRAGLYLIQNGIAVDTPELAELRKCHCLPQPRLPEGRFLARQKGSHAAIDISDGLATDLKHIAENSQVGFCIQAGQLPVDEALLYFCRRFNLDPIAFAVAGGEEYELICTIAENQAEQIAQSYLQTFQKPLVCIGEVTAPDKLELVYPDGRVDNLSSISSWEHFK